MSERERLGCGTVLFVAVVFGGLVVGIDLWMQKVDRRLDCLERAIPVLECKR